jgi:TolA-binding protein
VPAPEETPARPDPEEETTVVPETAIAERPVERPRAMPSGAVSAGPPPAAPPVDGAVSAEELARYRAAHRAHFVDQDSARAIVAWDAYLAAHPNGNFAIEARYNRAIALIRVGRSAEARAALAPFASGSVAGGYRAKEARTLLDALDRTNPRPTDPRPTDAEPSDARPVVF